MGIGDRSILSVGSAIEETALEMLSKLVDSESELISIYYGEDIEEEDAATLESKIQELYSDCDVELHQGNQPIYYYIISVE